MAREDFDEKNLELIIEDVMGETPLDNPKLKTVLDQLNSKTGWTSVKKSVQELVTVCSTNYKRQLLGEPLLPVMLNRLFLGNPVRRRES